MGGLGKTRLSLQIAADMLDSYPDGIWFMDLAPIRDPTFVANEVAHVLSVREEPGKPLSQTLCAHLKSRKALLIFDNCEQVVSACASLANAILRAAPDVRIIASSREALRVPGEQVYPVLPLALPSPTASVETLSQSEAVQLFMARAQLQKPSFMLTEREAPAVAELVSRVEGIPLALELAAARMRSLSIQEINKRLHNRFTLLTGGGRVLLERQQTLRALVAWSYDLLADNEKLLFERLGVFVGGFDLPAAEVVCGADPLMPEDVLDLVMSLVDKSLVMVRETDGESRYRMLETLRDFGLEALRSAASSGNGGGHCKYYFVWWRRASNRGLQGPEQADWTRRLEAEHDNMRAAIAFALGAGGDPIIAVKIEVALMGFRILRGYSTEGRSNVHERWPLPAKVQGIGHSSRPCTLCRRCAGEQSERRPRSGTYAGVLPRAAARDQQPDRHRGNLVHVAAVVRLHVGDAVRARDGEEEALATSANRVAGTKKRSCCCRLVRSACTTAMMRRRAGISSSRSPSHASQCHETESDCERMLGQLALECGDLPAACERFERALAICQDAADKRGAATALWWLGKADLADRNPASARLRLGEALRAFQSFEMNAEVLDVSRTTPALRILSIPRRGSASYSVAAAIRERLVLPRAPRGDQRWGVDAAARRSRWAMLLSTLRGRKAGNGN